MAFAVTKKTQVGGSTTRKEVDWAKMQAEVIEVAKTANKARSIPGIITGIIDLGIQKRPDSEEEFKGDESAQAAEIAKDSSVYFVEKGGKVFRCRPQRDAQQVAIAVDFPQILVDKSKYFTDKSDPKPLRLILNGENSLWMITRKEEDKRVKVLQKGFSLTETKHPNGKWGFDKKNTIYKLADACDLVNDGIFKPEQIDQLIGKAAQFTIRVYEKETKGKKYYTEEIKLAGMIPEGVVVPEHDPSLHHLIQFDATNDQSALDQLRQSVINTIVRATNFEGSVLAGQLGDRVKPVAGGSSESTNEPVANESSDESFSKPEFNDELPF